MMRLLSGPVSMFGAKAEIAAIEKGIDVKVEMVPFSIREGYSPKPADVTRINPKAEVPVLIDIESDVEVYESTQIFEYFEDIKPRPSLWPESRKARAYARLLELEVDEVFFIPLVAVQMPRRRKIAGPEKVAEAKTMLHEYYAKAEEALEAKEFLAWEFSYADIGFYMASFFADFLGQPWGSGHPNLDRWCDRMTSRDSIQRVAGSMATYLESHGVQAPRIAP